MLADRTTLVQFLIEERRRHPDASGDLNGLILDVALACKAISKRVAGGALDGVLGSVAHTNVQGEVQQKLDVVANEYFLRATEWSGHVAGMVSEELEEPYRLPTEYPRGKYLLLFDPLDGSSNIDVNVSVGSIFSILKAAAPGVDPELRDFLQPGSRQVCAGYAIYGPSTMLVLSVGTGVHAFTLDPNLGEFVLTRESIRIQTDTKEFAINASNQRFWEPAVQRYVRECLAGRSGSREKDFNMRWVASLVAETHRILTRGGIFLYPRDSREPLRPGRLRLLYEANPVAFLIEQAGGLASTGRKRVLDVVPREVHQRVSFIFGAREEVTRIEEYHCESYELTSALPLYGTRGLFRTAVV
jgi:fructose-1,6-bisphosphatase I / sedoheptulose-1,7-bisphosphatase